MNGYDLVCESMSNPSIKRIYNQISKILYAYMDKKGNIIKPSYHKGGHEWSDGDGNIDSDESYFIEHYISKSAQEILRTKVGICGDAVEATRFLMDKANIQYKEYYLEQVKYHNGHSFIGYVENDNYYWFETSWRDHNGIHQFNSEKDMLIHIAQLFKSQSHDNSSKIIINHMIKNRSKGLDVHQLIKRGQKGKRIISV